MLDRKMNKMNLLTLRACTAPHPRKFDGRFNVLFERWRRGRRIERGATSSDPHAEMRGPKPLRVSAFLSAPRCDTTQLLFIPIQLAPIYGICSLDTLPTAAPQMHAPMSPRKENKKEWRFSSAVYVLCVVYMAGS